MTTEIGPRLDDFARRLAALERELLELRELAQARGLAAEPLVRTEPVPSPQSTPSATVREPVQAPAPPPAKPPRVEQPPRATRWWEREIKISWEDLFGAKALAWAGGLVTLLGILFFFVLAVNRGWIGPVARVSLGALASLVVFGAGFWLRRTYGPAHSALAAAGAGIAGGYATLLAATALYDLVPRGVALALAAAIAAVGTATALAWSSELLAGLGLIGATLAPAAIALQDGEWSAIGTTFVALMFAGTATVAVAVRWERLLTAGLVASLPQVAGLVWEAGVTDWDVVAVAAAFWLLYLATATAFQLRLRLETLAPLPTTFVLAGSVLAGLSSVHLFAGDDRGWALLVVAGVEALAAVALFPRARDRDLSAFLGAVALALGAVAVAVLLSGPALTIAWAAEAAVLAWLARRVDEMRYQVASLAYLGAAFVHALFWEAPLRQLYNVTETPADGIVAVIAVGVAAVAFGWYARPWASAPPFRGVFAVIAPVLEAFRGAQALLRSASGWTGALAAVYAASLGVLQLGQWLADGGERAAFEWSHVAVTGLWGLAALGTLALGLVRGPLQVRLGGLAGLAAVLLQAVLFDASLESDARGYAFLVAGAALAAGALLDRLSIQEAPAFSIIAGFVLASIGLGVAGVLELTSGDWEGYALLALAAGYCVIATLVYRRDRDLSTVFWAPALVVAGYAASTLLAGTWLVLAWASAASVLAALTAGLEERRLQLASFGFLAFAAAHALAIEAPPADLFDANPHPENGVPALLFTLVAAAAFAAISRGQPDPLAEQPTDYERWSYELRANQSTWRRGTYGAAAILGIYAGSLAILGLAEALGGGSVATDFQRGHSAVSAFWGVIGLGALYFGLRRGRTWLRVAGFALFGLALAKLFLYDLAFLSSITRAFSFLAVGAVLLIGGFFVQKLGTERRAPAT
jgi:uncharacterized membrane protein